MEAGTKGRSWRAKPGRMPVFGKTVHRRDGIPLQAYDGGPKGTVSFTGKPLLPLRRNSDERQRPVPHSPSPIPEAAREQTVGAECRIVWLSLCQNFFKVSQVCVFSFTCDGKRPPSALRCRRSAEFCGPATFRAFTCDGKWPPRALQCRRSADFCRPATFRAFTCDGKRPLSALQRRFCAYCSSFCRA